MLDGGTWEHLETTPRSGSFRFTWQYGAFPWGIDLMDSPGIRIGHIDSHDFRTTWCWTQNWPLRIIALKLIDYTHSHLELLPL